MTAVAGAAACGIKTNQVAIGQKTSLEKQLMGEVEPLTEEEMLVSSVRAPGGVQAGSEDDLQTRAIAARRRQLFNRDDVDELKSRGCLGEARAAALVIRSCSADDAAAALRDRLLAEENADRQAIIDWALAADPILTATDRPQVVEIYGRLLRERARPGDWLEDDEGNWRQREQ
jgi:uncharacterized protein YdbL (DUF1318 family)